MDIWSLFDCSLLRGLSVLVPAYMLLVLIAELRHNVLLVVLQAFEMSVHSPLLTPPASKQKRSSNREEGEALLQILKVV